MSLPIQIIKRVVRHILKIKKSEIKVSMGVHESFLLGLLKIRNERINIVDLGAALYWGKEVDSSYRTLFDKDACNLFLIDANAQETQELKQFFGARATVITEIVGNGEEVNFYECNEPSAASCFMPNIKLIDGLQWFDKPLSIEKTHKLKSKTLDDIFQHQQIDFLLMDVQGAELSIINSSPETLSRVCVIQTEADFIPIYLNQPLFADIDTSLRKKGFQIHTFSCLGLHSFYPFKFSSAPKNILPDKIFLPKQLTYSKAVYVRNDFANFKGDKNSIIRGALIMHEIYKSYDIAFRLLREHDKIFGEDLSEKYLKRVK